MRPVNALPAVIEEHMAELRALCEKYHVRRLTLFGSAVKGTFDETRSDLDFSVEFHESSDPIARGGWYLDLLDALEKLFGREIDLVSRIAVQNPYFREELEETERELYAA